MNKIIIAGHLQSGFEEVHRLLVDCGMAAAIPSHRDNFTPEQISQTLLKAHGVVPVAQWQSSQPIQQVQVAPIWQGMVLDLMLSNLEQSLWGWADSNVVYLLDYWKEQDPQVVFVLVYDDPETILTRATNDQADVSPEELQRRIDAWSAYNSVLLHFHLRNAGRSVLVHAGQMQTLAKHSLHQINAHITAPLQLSPSMLAEEKLADLSHPMPSVLAESIESVQAQLQTLQGNAFKKERKSLRAKLKNLQLIAKKAEPNSMPASSLAVAETDLSPAKAEAVGNEAPAIAVDALAQMLAEQLLSTHPQAKQLFTDLQAAATLPKAKVEQASPAGGLPALQSDFDLGPLQAWKDWVQHKLLLQVQISQNKSQADRIQELQLHLDDGVSAVAAALQKQLHWQTELEKTQADLQQQQQLAITQKKAADEESHGLLTQLHQVQEELESRYLKIKQQETTLAELSKLKVDLKAAQEKASAVQAVGQEKQKLQEQLSKVQQELTRQTTQNQQQEKILEELPKVKAHLKAAQEAAKKQVSEHNNAKAIDLQKENELLLAQLHKVQEELEHYYLENAQFKALAKPKPLYGAADRVKKQLPYRLGATMIKRSGSVSGLLSMPIALRAEAKRIRAEQGEQSLPPISEYRDAHEAAQVQNHLSYRLGETWIQRTQSLGGWITLPSALYAQVKEFRKQRS